MRITSVELRAAFAGLLMAFIISACDTYEDPNLLNPPLPDSSGVRVINLLERDGIDVSFPGIPVTTGLAPFTISPYRRVLLLEQSVLLLQRPGRATPDTVFNQLLGRGDSLDYFVLGNDTSQQVIRLGLGDQERIDLLAHKQRKVSFINAINDGTNYFVKVGCQSGSVLFAPAFFAQSPQSILSQADELSLYLFSSADSSRPLATARLPLVSGDRPLVNTYLIAARKAGETSLYVVRDGEGVGPLPPAVPETRTTATVELLNGLGGGESVSVGLDGSPTPIATGLAPFTISAPAVIDACTNPFGDSLVVSTSGGSNFKIPIALLVGGRALIVVYNAIDGVKAAVIDRTIPAIGDGNAHLRGINIARSLPGASVSIGAGAPESVNADSRPFGTLTLGSYSQYVTLPPAQYPLMLSNPATGEYLNGGIEPLQAGYYTLVVATPNNTPVLLIVRDDVAGSALAAIGSQGSHATFFNMMPDQDATFTVGSQTPRALGFSYVYTSVLPFSITSVVSNAGNATVDPRQGNYLFGATGGEGSRTLLALRSGADPVSPVKAGVRFLNAVPGVSNLTVHIDGALTPATDTLAFGVPSLSRDFDERKYSVIITAAGDTTILARTDGVQISAGRRYVLVVGPKRNGSTSPLTYQTLWIQE